MADWAVRGAAGLRPAPGGVAIREIRTALHPSAARISRIVTPPAARSAAPRTAMDGRRLFNGLPAHWRQRTTADESVFIRVYPWPASSCVSRRLIELQQLDPLRQRPRTAGRSWAPTSIACSPP